VRITNADFESRAERLSERNPRYKNIKNTPINTLTIKIIGERSPSRIEIIAKGTHTILITRKKSLSIESFTSSGEIHL